MKLKITQTKSTIACLKNQIATIEALGLHRIFLKVYPHNARAIHVYEKCGFREYDRTEKDVFMEIVP